MGYRVYNLKVVITDSINNFSIKNALRWKKSGVEEVVITAPTESAQESNPGYFQRSPYTIDEYIAIKHKIDELTEGIDKTMPEKERFAELYKRVCNNITYDYAAAAPKTEEERQYARKNLFNSRNLRNGLLEGKCVCAGYADILRTALEKVEIEAIYVSGPIVKDRTNQKRKIESYKKLSKIKVFKKVLEKRIEELENQQDPYHAWVKVKLDGKWYNADPTWDSEDIRNGKIPYYVLQTDEECKESNKLYNPGPRCITKFPEEEKNKLFEIKNKDITEQKIPMQKGLKAGIKKIKNVAIEKHKEVKSIITNSIQKLKNKLAKGKKELPPAEQLPELKTWDEENNEFYIINPMWYYSENAKKSDSKNKPQTQKLKSWDLRNWEPDKRSVNPQQNLGIHKKDQDIER